MTTLIVASAGGHVTQARLLADRLAEHDRVWVTYAVEQALATLAREEILVAHGPTTKNIPNAWRNYRLARHVFSELPIDKVISTGAALAVPFFIRARQLGIACHYIESATRVQGPSLTGRLLERMPEVRLYRQMGAWGAPRWTAGPSVFDGFRIASREPRRAPRSAFVSLGTHNFPFTRAVRQLALSFDQAGVTDITWQLGSTPDEHLQRGRVVQFLSPREVSELIEHSDVVAGHAGTGLTLTSLLGGRVPLLIPRRRHRGEHTDDHQVQLADELGRRGLAVSSEVEDLSAADIMAAANQAVTRLNPPPFSLTDQTRS